MADEKEKVVLTNGEELELEPQDKTPRKWKLPKPEDETPEESEEE